MVSQLDAPKRGGGLAPLAQDRQREIRDNMLRIEGEERFEGVQKFLAAVHRLTSERRLSRIACIW